MGNYLITMGDLKDGFKFIGPFTHYEDALAHVEDHKLTEATVHELLPPQKMHHHKAA
jgi:hypothetical protein